MIKAPELLAPDPDAYVERATSLAPAFLEGWAPRPADPGYAVAKAFSRFMAALAQRVNEAPDKNKLAFYDMLGLSLLPASSGRAPIAFEPVPHAGDAPIPVGTRVGATNPETGQPIVFLTEQPLVVPGARLTEVWSVWPGRDAVANHSYQAVRGEPFTWFDDLTLVPHHLYISHDRILNLQGPGRIEIAVDLARPATEPLTIRWEYWDGEVWRSFKEFDTGPFAPPSTSRDGTLGLTRSGVITLASDCMTAQPTRVRFREGYWIRGRIEDALPRSVVDQPPEIERLSLESAVDRSLPAGDCDALGEASGIIPDHAYANDVKLDLTKSIEPMGTAPQLGAAFYLAANEAFSRPGADVELCFARITTPQDEADAAAAAFGDDVGAATEAMLDVARKAADAALELMSAPSEIGVDAEGILQPEVDAVQTARDDLTDLSQIGALRDAVSGLVDAWENPNTADEHDVTSDVMAAVTAKIFAELAQIVLVGGAALIIPPIILPAALSWLERVTDEAQGVLDDMRDTLVDLHQLLEDMTSEGLTGYTAAVSVGAAPPSLGEPEVAWEYFNGRRWRALFLQDSPPEEVKRLRETGRIRFVVPSDAEASEHAGVEAHWIRVRLVGGAYGVLRLTSWKDQDSGRINFFPIIEHRPPVIDRVRLGYTYSSGLNGPESTLTYNDFNYRDETLAAASPGSSFVPFRPIEDLTPAMYFGFDGELPTGDLGFHLNLREVLGEPKGPTLLWEGWDGAAWSPVSTHDETAGMALPGIVRTTWPGGPSVPEALVMQTDGNHVTLVQPIDAVKFQIGDEVFLSNDDGGELAQIAVINGRDIKLEGPLEGSYSGGRIAIATLARFGNPRWWVRARLQEDEPPRRAHVEALVPNATWSTQIQILDDEVLGSGSGEPDQVFFLRHRPIVGEATIEVRELQGARAEVERTLLLDQIARQGLSEADIREVRATDSGKLTEIWVRWRETRSRHFANPEQRVFVLERRTGRVLFPGLPVPAGSGNVAARQYQTTEGIQGNVATGSIDQLMSGAVVQGVRNVAAGHGAANGEEPAAVLERGPAVIRNRLQAVTRSDYEELAREANPAVAVARALPATHPSGRHAPGWVTVRIIPHSDESHPIPSFGLRESVRRFIAARVPISLQGRLSVVPADFFDVGALVVVERNRSVGAADVSREVDGALQSFFHPLVGGPNGRGWPFGRGVHASDVASRIGHVRGVEVVQTVSLTLHGTPVGNHAEVPRDRLVAAGLIVVRVVGGES